LDLLLVHELRLLGSWHCPQIGVLLTSFSARGTEYSDEDRSGEYAGDRGMYHFLGSEISEKLQLCVRAHYGAARKDLESRNPLRI
jgi:hypothetical protein